MHIVILCDRQPELSCHAASIDNRKLDTAQIMHVLQSSHQPSLIITKLVIGSSQPKQSLLTKFTLDFFLCGCDNVISVESSASVSNCGSSTVDKKTRKPHKYNYLLHWRLPKYFHVIYDNHKEEATRLPHNVCKT